MHNVVRIGVVHVVEDVCLQDLRECLHDACVLVAVYLDLINQGDFDLGPFAEWLENGGEFLSSVRWSCSGELRGADMKMARTPTSRRASPSIWSGLAFQSTEVIRPCQIHWISSVSGSGCSSSLSCMAEMI